MWDRMRVNRIKAGAYLDGGGLLHVEGDASPADALQAARELLGEDATFNGIGKWTGYLIFTTETEPSYI